HRIGGRPREASARLWGRAAPAAGSAPATWWIRTPQPSVPAWQARYREAMSASASTVEPYTLDVPRRPDPYPYYAALRREEPAHYSPVEDIWVLTRFDACLAAVSDSPT